MDYKYTSTTQSINEIVSQNLKAAVKKSGLTHHEIAKHCMNNEDKPIYTLNNVLYGKCKTIKIEHLKNLKDYLDLSNDDIFQNSGIPDDKRAMSFRGKVLSPFSFSTKNAKVAELVKYFNAIDNAPLVDALHFLLISDKLKKDKHIEAQHQIIKYMKLIQKEILVDKIIESPNNITGLEELFPEHLEVKGLLAKAAKFKRSPSFRIPLYLDALKNVLEICTEEYGFILSRSLAKEAELACNGILVALDQNLKAGFESIRDELISLCQEMQKEQYHFDSFNTNDIQDKINKVSILLYKANNFKKPPSKRFKKGAVKKQL